MNGIRSLVRRGQDRVGRARWTARAKLRRSCPINPGDLIINPGDFINPVNWLRVVTAAVDIDLGRFVCGRLGQACELCDHVGVAKKNKNIRVVVMRAFGGALGGAALRLGLEATLARLGWAAAGDGVAWGTTLDLTLYESASGKAWVVMEGNLTSATAMVPEVARACNATIVAHEVVGRDRPVPTTDEPGEFGYDIQVQSREVLPSGAVGVIEPYLSDEDTTGWHGDLDTTTLYYLWQLMDPETGAEGEEWSRTWSQTVVRAAGATLSPRLADLVQAIRLAGSWTAEQQGERWLVMVDSPATGKRMSALSNEELAQVSGAVDIPPR